MVAVAENRLKYLSEAVGLIFKTLLEEQILLEQG
jgi:hypothetical protein